MRFKLFLLLIPFLWVQCKSVPQSTEEDALWFEMKRTRCFGSCPAYNVKIFQSGKVSYTGEKFVPLEGNKEFTLSKGDLELIRQELNTIGFFELQDKYYEDVTDLPTTYLTYYKGDQKKEVMDYYGAPDKLKAMEEKIQNIIFAYLY